MNQPTTVTPDDASTKHSVTAPLGPLTACETVHEMSGAIQALEDYGLRLGDTGTMTTDAVEQVLITDEWSCEVCGRSSVPVCPTTGKPHRRRLVRIAQDILRLVGRRVGKAYTRPARLAERLDGKVRVRTERHMAVNPQLLLLAFYFAAPDSSGDGTVGTTGFVTECARHLLDLLQQVERYGRRVLAEMDEPYSSALLKSFYSAWKEYLKHASGEVATNDQAETRVSSDELFNGTRNALLAAAKEGVRDPTNSDLKAFVALLYQRVQRLATREQLAAVEEALARVEQQTPTHTPLLVTSPPVGTTDSDAGAAAESGAPTATFAADDHDGVPSTTETAPPALDETPRIGHSNPPLMPSDLNTTSGSEADALPPAAAARALSYVDGKPQLGPELPPDWYVDETGRSRPKPGFEERKKREKYLQLEFRARKAYEAVMNVGVSKTGVELEREALVAAVSDAQLNELARQLNEAKPSYALIPKLLRSVEEALVGALPRRFRAQLEQEFRDTLDWSVIMRRAANGQAALSSVLRFVAHKVILYGAPEREAAIRDEMERVGKDLDSFVPDRGTAVANAFRFLFASVKTLREDVATYSLLLVSNELRTNALGYIRAFVEACLPRPALWSGSIVFLRRFVQEESVLQWTRSKEATGMVLLSEQERRVRGALLFGLVDLLRSGSHTTADRWSQLPAEIFYFEKSYIFTAANTVQECTLLLLLEGTVATILSSKGCSHAQVSNTLKHLHDHILQLLSQDLKLAALKVAVSDFLDDALEKLASSPGSAATATSLGGSTDPVAKGAQFSLLTEAQRNVISATIEKMTNTESALYVSFETKVVQFMTRIMCKETDVAPLGLVTDAATKQATLLSKLLAFNWEVYRPFYQTMMPLLGEDA